MTTKHTKQLEQRQRLEKQGKNQNTNNGMKCWIFGSAENMFFEENRDLHRLVEEESMQILSACLNCWSDFNSFRTRELFFSSLGLFGF